MLEVQSSTGLRDERKQRLTALSKTAFKWMSNLAFQKKVYELLDLEVEVVSHDPLRIRLRGKIDERLDTVVESLSRGT